ncbi:hypothetical protein LTR27_009912 [Elasticomyces elasticus]|nr:hypothetical protein LTR27_009912 [Elasticomyces elasticus]
MDTLTFIAHLNNTQLKPPHHTQTPATTEMAATAVETATLLSAAVVLMIETGPKSTLPMPLPKGAAELFRTEKYSDVDLICGERTWKLHKSIICMQSEIFAQFCEQCSPKKAQKLCLVLLEDEVSVVAAMVYYLYHGEYDVAAFTSEHLSAMELHVKLYFLAMKYSIAFLDHVACSKLQNEMEISWGTDGFAHAVAEIYLRTGRNDDLRKMAVDYTAIHATKLFAPASSHTKFNRMARSTSEFAADVTAALAGSEYDDIDVEMSK